jgi:hypothetical protein
MAGNLEEQELRERLNLIETMIAEGRRSHERWGWVFVLWGVAYYVAILWSTLAHYPYAWPVTMITAMALTMVLAARKTANRPSTTLGRAISSVWIALGVSMLVLFPALGFSGRITDYVLISVASAMLGMANAASAITLRWKAQFACALIWWGLSVFACFGGSKAVDVVLLSAIFLCMIVFGFYCMMAEARERKQQEASHA